jgi:hypothetical protein
MKKKRVKNDRQIPNKREVICSSPRDRKMQTKFFVVPQSEATVEDLTAIEPGSKTDALIILGKHLKVTV